MGGGGTDRKRKADAPRRTRHLSGRLIGSSLCSTSFYASWSGRLLGSSPEK